MSGSCAPPALHFGIKLFLIQATGRPVAKGKSVEMEDIKFHQCVRQRKMLVIILLKFKQCASTGDSTGDLIGSSHRG